MKKLGRKLILSAVALGAVATTAVSTTFAWYVSNDTVTATAITAKTDTAGSNSLQISADGVKWNATATPSVKNVNLKPVYYKDGKFYDLAGEEVTEGTADTTSSGTTVKGNEGYYAFDLYFRNIGLEDAGNVYLKAFTLTNTTATLPSETALADFGTLDHNTNGEYTVDLLRTLNLRISSQTRVVTAHTVDASGTANVTAGTEATKGNENGYTLKNYHDSKNKEDSLDTYPTANAHKYYNAAKNITYSANKIQIMTV